MTQKIDRHLPVSATSIPVSHLLLSRLFILATLLLVSYCVNSTTLDSQRQQYQQARKALRAGNIEKFLTLAEGVRDYPLYPYLRYNYLQPRLQKAEPAIIEAFIKEFPDLPATESLRTQWLKHLARTRQWQAFNDNYTPQDDPTLKCNYLVARMQTNNHTLLLEDIRTIWLSGSSLPPDCDPVFKLLYQSDLFSNELIWQRIELAMRKNNTGLANYLGRYLDGYYKQALANWIAVHNKPDHYTARAQLEDTNLNRQILKHGIMRLAHINIDKAVKNWDTLQTKYEFLPDEDRAIDKVIAIIAARKNHARAIELMDKIVPFDVDDEVLHWRLVTALNNNDWRKLREWTEGVPNDEALKYRWFYWHARALEQTGEAEKAQRIYASIAGKRDYYGFLAADRMGIAYNMEHQPLPDVPEEKDRIKNLPGIQRADELRAIGETRQARREWHHALRLLTSYQKEIAARLAADWAWHDMAIISLGSAHSYDDLEVRFPIPYESLISQNAEKRQLDAGWVYALVRSESAFIEDVKSPAGALGLMQVMPRTGKETAKRMGIKNFRITHLLEADKNVPIGSTYLKQMLDRFNGNMILATAAYNAGPHRVKSWLPKSGCIEPDIWVERIPFNETRKYVRRVMFFASIYDWRLNREVLPLQQRMATVTADSGTLVAGLTCAGPEVTYN